MRTGTKREAAADLSLRALWDILMVALALGSLWLIARVELDGLEWPDPEFKRLAAIDLAIVVVFTLELGWRFYRTPDRRAFIKAQWYELPGLIPLYAETLSLMRLTRLMRVIRVLRLLRVVDAARRISSALRFIRRVLVASRIAYTLTLSLLVILVMAAMVWWLERGHNPALANFSEALWWAVVTVTTVGYGDITPKGESARLVAGALMFVGIGLIGTVSSSLGAAVIAVGRRRREPRERSLADELERLVTLHERGYLTADELAAAKRRVLPERTEPQAHAKKQSRKALGGVRRFRRRTAGGWGAPPQ